MIIICIVYYIIEMKRAYIYLISFEGSNDIYIGKTTQNIFKRFKNHKWDKTSAVYNFVKEKLNNDWSKVYIDIIDSIDMNENLTYLFNHPLNTYDIKHDFKHTSCCKTNEHLLNHKLTITEFFHINNYKKEGKYNIINKYTQCYNVYKTYKFFNNPSIMQNTENIKNDCFI